MADQIPLRKVTYRLEMNSPDELKPAKAEGVSFDVHQVGAPFPELNWLLHQTVGADYRWGGRADWGQDEWNAYVDRPELQTWIAYVQGAPAGYYEIEKHEDGSVQIECFGLRKMFFGQGIGGRLLTKAVECCWAMGASRVWLKTCSQDHPLALSNYRARGFKVVEITSGQPNPPYVSDLFGGK